MKRIVFLSHAAGAGGAEKCLAMLLAGLPREKYAPLVLSRRRSRIGLRPQGLEVEVRRLGIALRFVDLKWWARDWRHDAAFARGLGRRVEAVAEILRAENADLVVTNTSVVVEGALAARQCGVPHIWHILEMLSRDPGLDPLLPLPKFYGLMHALSRRIVVVAEAVKAELERFVAGDKITVLHTGIPPLATSHLQYPKRQALRLEGDPPVVTFVGLLSQRKGVLDLIEAARIVAADYPAARFVLAGRDGGVAAEAASWIREYGLREQVHLLGPRGDVPDILAATDVFVLPALADPLPVAVLEAMSLGVPVVATRSGGCEEMIVDGETGLLTPTGDPAALAAAIGHLLGNPDLRAEMGRGAKDRFAARFSHQRHAAALVEILDDAMGTVEPPGDVQETICRLQTAALTRWKTSLHGASFGKRLVARLIDLLYRSSVIR